jgi:hypothetical protein
MPGLFTMQINGIQSLYLIIKLHKSWCCDIPPPFGIYKFIANNTDILSHQIHTHTKKKRLCVCAVEHIPVRQTIHTQQFITVSQKKLHVSAARDSYHQVSISEL